LVPGQISSYTQPFYIADLKLYTCLSHTFLFSILQHACVQASIPPPTTTTAQDGVDKISQLLIEYELYIDGIQFGLPFNTRLKLYILS